MGTDAAGRWCECADAPRYARGAATLLDHPMPCAFPDGACEVRSHRVTVHAKCGRELLVRYCGCGDTGFTLDPARGWWVHYACGWPSRAWFETTGSPAPDELAGLRPVTYHEFPVLPDKQMTDEQKVVSRAHAGAWVRD
jgi:hypothetical protein